MGRRKSIGSSESSGSESGSDSDSAHSHHHKKEKKEKDKKPKKDKDSDKGKEKEEKKKEKEDKKKDKKEKEPKDKEKEKEKKDKEKEKDHDHHKDKDKEKKKSHDHHKDKDKDKKNKGKEKEEKKEKKVKDRKLPDESNLIVNDEPKRSDQVVTPVPAAAAAIPSLPQPTISPPLYPAQPLLPPMSFGFDDSNTRFPGYDSAPPPSGYRIPLSTDTPFPSSAQTGWPPLYDADGSSPIFIGSALFENSVHPCKIGPHLSPSAMVAYGGVEHPHQGRYDLLPFIPEQMEWVPTAYGRVPEGRRPIEGGYEDNGAKLYHGLAMVHGVQVPGKAGEHLNGCNVSFGGEEIAVHGEHQILCWR